jgi:hypothetical protein
MTQVMFFIAPHVCSFIKRARLMLEKAVAGELGQALDLKSLEAQAAKVALLSLV